MLVIENIDVIKRCTYSGRYVRTVNELHRNGMAMRDIYVFRFNGIGKFGVKVANEWVGGFEVWLNREVMDDGTYRLFVANQYAATCENLNLNEIRNFNLFHSRMENVVLKFKTIFYPN